MEEKQVKSEKDKKIDKEYRRLKGLFCELTDQKKAMADSQMQRAAFMRIALEELEETIKIEGTLDLFEQGDYSYNREHPAAEIIQRNDQKLHGDHQAAERHAATGGGKGDGRWLRGIYLPTA